MMVLLILLLIIIATSGIWIPFEVIHYIRRKDFISKCFFRIAEVVFIILLPALFFMDEGSKINDCCSDTAYFSPKHRLSIELLILVCIFFYFFASYRKTITAPLMGLFTNFFLIIGLVINVVMLIHSSKNDSPDRLTDPQLMILFQIPIILLELFALIRKHQLDVPQIISIQKTNSTKTGAFLSRILSLKFFYKFPLLLILCVPILGIISSLLLLLGQKADSFIKAFTETYYHGFSQLDCTNVPCPHGHFLCTIAAGGHNGLVKPLRKGIRHGHVIRVNRQLLIANAFENLLEENLPACHKIIRKTYDFIGGNYKKLYDILGNKWVSDCTYILMKPLELFFLFSLYLFDKKPENRIEMQYIDRHGRQKIEEESKNFFLS
jgi:hypothetical protein